MSKAIKEYEKNKENAVLQWMKFLDNPEDMEVRKIMEENGDIKEAKEELEKLSQDDKLRRMALKAELERMDQEQRIYEIKRDFEQIKRDNEKKLDEAKKDSKIEGEAIGEARGIKKNQEETALKMLKKQIDIQTIKEITGLTEEKINSLKSNNLTN